MDTELHDRIESLEELCRQVLDETRKARQELSAFRDEQRQAWSRQDKHNVETKALLEQLGIRVGEVEDRMGGVEDRMAAVEKVVFDSRVQAGQAGAQAGEPDAQAGN